MVIGIPKEIKTDEYRVGAVPFNIATWIKEGHEVYVEADAGKGSGFSDNEYVSYGAKIVQNAKELYASSTLIVKVKEPQREEYPLLNDTHILFCYLHLAPLKELSEVLMQKGVTAISYETVYRNGELPLLKPMSEIAGKISVLAGANNLSRYSKGEGVLIGGAIGVEPAKVLIIGAGNAGFNAAKDAYWLGADVTVINRSTPKLEQLKHSLPYIKTLLYSAVQLHDLIVQSDLVISTVLIHGGAKAPKLITKEMLKQMKNGSVFVDIAIDQGGTAETSKPTTHTSPTFVEEGVIHYCVANMPGAYPKTSSFALTNATAPYVSFLAKKGFEKAVKEDRSLALGVNVYKGCITTKPVAEALDIEYSALETLL